MHLLISSASEVTTLWHYTNLFIIIIIIIIIIDYELLDYEHKLLSNDATVLLTDIRALLTYCFL